MDNPFLKLTVTDRQILNSYALMLNGLGAYLGDGYELVLHSLESLDHSVIKIINGHFTGRKEGSPITDLALKMLGELEQDPSRTVSPYFNKSSSDSMLRSCTIPITGEHGRFTLHKFSYGNATLRISARNASFTGLLFCNTGFL